MKLLGALLQHLKWSRAMPSPALDLEQVLSDGMAAFMAGDLKSAARACELALGSAPHNPDALYLAGVVSYARGDWDIAIAYLEQAIEKGGAKPAYLKDYGGFLASVGRHREALSVLRRALALDPGSARVHSNLLFVIGCCDHVSADEVCAAHRFFGQRVADALMPETVLHANSRDPDRPLTIGYVSADLREHAVRYFIEPVLAGHDRARHRIVCYSSAPVADETTGRLRAMTDLWRDIAGMSDTDAAAMMRADGIDILVDLSGHTRGNRLLALARKPAPVQVTWFGAVQTTGMKAIDWRLTDEHIDPPGLTERLSCERLMRLAHSYACFRPHPDSPAVGPLPALAGGIDCGITFASVNSGHKINDAVVALWARLISSVPRSRLLVVIEHGELPDIQRMVAARFAASGLDPSRLEIAGRRPMAGFLQLLHSVDVLLDPFPQNGGITSLHALWMGVPVISLAGAAPIGRIGVSLLSQLGLESFVARDHDGYVEIARRCATDLAGLADLRAGLRERMRASTLMDEKGFMRDLESAYRDMWREWCNAR